MHEKIPETSSAKISFWQLVWIADPENIVLLRYSRDPKPWAVSWHRHQQSRKIQDIV